MDSFGNWDLQYYYQIHSNPIIFITVAIEQSYYDNLK